MRTVRGDALLPADAVNAVLLGRVWDADVQGPTPVVVRGSTVVDASSVGETTSAILERADAAEALQSVNPSRSWELDTLLGHRPGDSRSTRLLAPIDLQVIKACGVTHRTSLIERIVEQLAGGDAQLARAAHADVDGVAATLSHVKPGTPEAIDVLETLVIRGIPRQYLEVGLGPDPEVFTKAPVLAAMGAGERIGVPSFSQWSNPEPEMVVICDSRGAIRGASLGNDVNLRDVEGRSALLLGRAKDNNGSCAIGPFIRLIDDRFTYADVASAEVHVTVTNPVDGCRARAHGSTAELLRPIDELVAAAHGAHHQHPDGFALFTGSLAVVKEDRMAPGRGFTHVVGDQVVVSNDRLGALTNTVGISEQLDPWEFGISALYSHLARRREASIAGGRS